MQDNALAINSPPHPKTETAHYHGEVQRIDDQEGMVTIETSRIGQITFAASEEVRAKLTLGKEYRFNGLALRDAANDWKLLEFKLAPGVESVVYKGDRDPLALKAGLHLMRELLANESAMWDQFDEETSDKETDANPNQQ